MGTEYPGEGAMNNILIAGSTNMQGLMRQSSFLADENMATSLMEIIKDLLKQVFLS